jgi:hypothetical protein
MRRDWHFGVDDPLYYPQPFSTFTGHLAVLRSASTNPSHVYALAWYILRPVDFVSQDEYRPWGGYGSWMQASWRDSDIFAGPFFSVQQR